MKEFFIDNNKLSALEAQYEAFLDQNNLTEEEKLEELKNEINP